MYLLEAFWTRAVRKKKRRFRYPKIALLITANAGAVGIAVFSFTESSKAHTHEIIVASYLGIVVYAVIRFLMEKIRIRVGVEAVRQRIS